MYLKRLEIQGFKSFADKLSLEFGKGISAVVGPNGSGKSNISDAVRWALGEQSLKTLRGSRMEDIIFSGTVNRRPLNFAEVSIIIDNQDLAIPVDYSEIIVTRRVYRSGESQFMINGTSVRLRDIHELFYDTGVGREGYSIIGQGKIDEILSARSEDRRNLFEEAAGIIKYKTKRNESELRLERERQNLLRAEDILAELGSQLGPLHAQSEKAILFLKLSERLKLVEINVFLLQSGRIRSELSKFGDSILSISESIENEKAAQLETAKAQEELATELEGFENSISNSLAEIQEKRLENEKCEGNIKLSLQKIDFCNSEIERLENEIALQAEAIAAAGKSKISYGSRLSDAENSLSAENEKLSGLEAEAGGISGGLREAEAELERYSGGHLEILHKSADIKSRIQTAENLYEQLEERKERLDDDRAELAGKKNILTAKISEAKERLTDNSESSKRLTRELELTLEERKKLEADASRIKKAADANYSALREVSSRKKLLTELEASHEGYYKSVKSVLDQKASNPAFEGVFGAVGELLRPELGYETAVETALGAAMQNIVVKTEEDAKAAIEYLKKTRDGRATFLPLSSVKGASIGDARGKLLAEPGILGIAKELVEYNAKFEGVISSLLGRVIVADNIDNAIAFCRRYSYKYKTVTLAGELFNAGGAITGGSAAKSASILGRSREIRELEIRIAVLEEEAEKLQNESGRLELKLSSVITASERLKFRLRELELSDTTENAGLAALEGQLGELEERADFYVEEERRIMEQLAETNVNIRTLSKLREELDGETEGIRKTLDERREDIRARKKCLDAKIEEQTAAKVGISALRGVIDSLRENIARINAETNALSQKIEQSRADIESQNYQIDLRKAEIEEQRERITALSVEERDLEAGAEKLAAEKKRVSDKISELRSGEFNSHETMNRLTNELTRHELRKEQAEAELKNLGDELWEKYNLTYNQVLSGGYERIEMSLTSLVKEQSGLKNEIKSLGAINVSAIDEYRAVSERHSFMMRQRNDIADAEAKLRDIIRDLTLLMEQQFIERFNAISDSFNIVFQEMFQGGRAFLRLEDPENVLDCGIDIISQPPGKNLQNMMLFSGGERALTAIALLFGILRLKPSPFCILDEIEAALDDANVLRFAEYIKKFSEETQFILITHRKGTMETADTLYGVTMQELGVSKLVSVKLADGNTIRREN